MWNVYATTVSSLSHCIFYCNISLYSTVILPSSRICIIRCVLQASGIIILAHRRDKVAGGVPTVGCSEPKIADPVDWVRGYDFLVRDDLRAPMEFPSLFSTSGLGCFRLRA